MIITRDWINDDITLTTTKSYSKNDLIGMINYWKHRLLNEGASYGDKIGIAIPSMEVSHIAVSFAAYELGLRQVILSKPTTEQECKNPKCNSHLPLDLFVYCLPKDQSFEIAKNHYIRNSKISIEIPSSFDEQSQIDTKVLCNENTDILLCTSSGTTGDPKLISQTHKFFFDLCSFNWSVLGFSNESRILHLSSFNHGSSLGVFYLPTLHVCKEHFFYFNAVTNKSMEYSIINMCHQKQITHMLSPNASMTDALISVIENFEFDLSNLTIMVLSFINPRWEKIVKKGKIKKIVSIFGCSETSGPLFLPTLDQYTENFSPRNLGEPVIGFHKIEVKDSHLLVTMPDDSVIDTGDIVTDDYHLIGKSKLPRIDDVEINVLDVIELIEQLASRNRFEVVIDEVQNIIFILTEVSLDSIAIENLLKDYYGIIMPIRIVEMPNLSMFITGIKPDREKIMIYLTNFEVDK
jgi:acyl-CoA synthetase (AMP-forming)/AMP-acid ligase II